MDKLQELQAKVAFLERHIEQMDLAFVEVNKDVEALKETVIKLVAQRKSDGSGSGTESSEDAQPPHY